MLSILPQRRQKVRRQKADKIRSWHFSACRAYWGGLCIGFSPVGDASPTLLLRKSKLPLNLNSKLVSIFLTWDYTLNSSHPTPVPSHPATLTRTRATASGTLPPSSSPLPEFPPDSPNYPEQCMGGNQLTGWQQTRLGRLFWKPRSAGLSK